MDFAEVVRHAMTASSGVDGNGRVFNHKLHNCSSKWDERGCGDDLLCLIADLLRS